MPGGAAGTNSSGGRASLAKPWVVYQVVLEYVCANDLALGYAYGEKDMVSRLAKTERPKRPKRGNDRPVK
jgi:hypothetical protein